MTDYTADQIRSVRLLIPDTEAIYGDGQDEYIIEDADLSLYLDLGHGNVKWAAGLACGAVGRSEALILKVITNYETKTDGATLAKVWLAHSAALIAEGKGEVDATDDGTSSYFESVSIGGDVATYPEGTIQGWVIDPLGPRFQ